MTELKDISKEIDKVLSDLKKIDPEFTDRKRDNMVKRAAKGMQNEMIRRAPKDTGDLALSIDFKKFRNNPGVFLGVIKNKVINYAGSIGRVKIDRAFIARFIEFGFTHIAWPKRGKRIGDYAPSRYKWIEGKPFIKPSFENKTSEWFLEMEKEAKTGLEKAERKMLKLQLKK